MLRKYSKMKSAFVKQWKVGEFSAQKMQWRSIKVVKTTTGKKKEAPQQQPAKVLPTAASLLQGNKKKASNATASAKKKKASKCAPPSQQQKQPQQKSRQQFQHFAEQPSTSKTPETQQKEPPKKQTKKQQLPAVALALLPPKTDKKKHKLGAKCSGESKVIRLRADGGAFRNRYARAIARRRRRAQKAAKRKGPRSELLQRFVRFFLKKITKVRFTFFISIRIRPRHRGVKICENRRGYWNYPRYSARTQRAGALAGLLIKINWNIGWKFTLFFIFP